MASFSPRASRLFSEPSMTRSYDQDIEQSIAGLTDLPNDCRTPVGLPPHSVVDLILPAVA